MKNKNTFDTILNIAFILNFDDWQKKIFIRTALETCHIQKCIIQEKIGDIEFFGHFGFLRKTILEKMNGKPNIVRYNQETLRKILLRESHKITETNH
jgi:hypothetical protein